VEPKPSVPEIFWGRLQSVAGVPADVGKIGSPDLEVATYYGNYAISRLKNSSFVMPNEGNAAFKLTGGEAVMTSSGTDRIANIETGQLSMDFSRKTFATSLVVAAGANRANVIGSGILTNTGMMYEDKHSDTTIRGYLGGANAEQAAYIFKNYANPGITVTGVTTWSR